LLMMMLKSAIIWDHHQKAWEAEKGQPKH
jgi:hypothetical protein